MAYSKAAFKLGHCETKQLWQTERTTDYSDYPDYSPSVQVSAEFGKPVITRTCANRMRRQRCDRCRIL